MSFEWPWPRANHQLYTSVQQEEVDSIADEKHATVAKPLYRYAWGLFLLSVLTNVVLLSMTLHMYFQRQAMGSTHHHHHHQHELVKSPIPQMPPEVKNFSTNRVFMDRPSEESDAAWEMLGGPPRDHRGFIFVENLEAYGLGSQRSDNGKKMYGVSMLHQLHCLGSIRKMLWGVLQGTMDAQELLDGYPRNTTDPTFEATTHGLWHISHCFDYIRQGIQCAGDMSLEWPIEINGENLVVGWNNPHECRSWDAAWRYIEEHS